VAFSIAALALGLQPKQGLTKVQAKSEARKSHFMHHDFIHNDTSTHILCIITIEHSNCYQRTQLMMHLGFWSGVDNKTSPIPI